jgi:hypothetical protein
MIGAALEIVPLENNKVSWVPCRQKNRNKKIAG